MSYNVVLIGSASVGKTSIANTLVCKAYSDHYRPTIGAAMIKIPYVDDEMEKYLFIWDTAGMEQYKSLAPTYYRDSSCAILVYDVSDENSLNRAAEWYDFYRETVEERFPVLIIGNKIDLERKISLEKCQFFADHRNCQLIEVSAKTGEGIEQIIPILRKILESSDLPDDCASVAQPRALRAPNRKDECC